MLDKHYWSMYYGIDENLPLKEFCQKIRELNSLAMQLTKRFTPRCNTRGGDVTNDNQGVV